MLKKTILMRLALATLIGMPLIAIVVDRFSDTVNLQLAITGDGNYSMQLLWGAIAGLGIAVGAHLLIASPLLNEVNTSYARLLGRFRLTFSEILLISLCAGVGEEMLFRGAVQPFLGIPITSGLFVAIHGYLNPRDWRLSVYGIFMTAGIAWLGYLGQTRGLLSAIVGHTLIDVYLLLYMQHAAKSIPVTHNPDLVDFPEEE
ncbi:MAG: CPBP family intramembrane glutamic endopeptidase [Flavobacteriales bacterium]